MTSLHNLTYIPLPSYSNLYSTKSLNNRIAIAVSDGRLRWIYTLGDTLNDVEYDQQFKDSRLSKVVIKQKNLRIAPELSDLRILSFDIFARNESTVMVVNVLRENEAGETHEIQFYNLTADLLEGETIDTDQPSSIIFDPDNKDQPNDRFSIPKRSHFTFDKRDESSKTQGGDWLFPFSVITLDYGPSVMMHGRKSNNLVFMSNDICPSEFANEANLLVISGNDYRLHTYTNEVDGRWNEREVDETFSILKHLRKGVVLSMDFFTVENRNVHFAAFGYVDNTVQFVAYQKATQEVIFNQVISLSSMVSSVKMFTFCQNDKNRLNLIAVCPLGGAYLFRNIKSDELANVDSLPNPCRILTSSCAEMFTVSTLYDYDLDGRVEIALGTQDGRLMIFKTDSEDDKTSWKSSEALYVHTVANGPVLEIKSLDFTSDGLNELVVASSEGISILQINLKYAIDVITERAKLYLDF